MEGAAEDRGVEGVCLGARGVWGASGKRVVRAQGHRDGRIAGLPAPGAGVGVHALDGCPLATGPLG